MSILISWLILSVVVWLTAAILPGIRIRRFWDAVIVALVFGLLNWALGWILFVVIGIATLGIGLLLFFITRWVVDAILLKLTDALTDRVEVDSFGWALGGALLIAGLGTILERVAAAIGLT